MTRMTQVTPMRVRRLLPWPDPVSRRQAAAGRPGAVALRLPNPEGAALDRGPNGLPHQTDRPAGRRSPDLPSPPKPGMPTAGAATPGRGR